MNNKEENFNLRNKRWLALCKRYEKRGKINTDDCSFSEVNYKLFAKPAVSKSRNKRKKKHPEKYSDNNSIGDSSCRSTEGKKECTLDVDISDIIDDDVYDITLQKSNNSEVDSNKRVLAETNKTTSKEIVNRSPLKVNKASESIKYPLDKENCITNTQNSLEIVNRSPLKVNKANESIKYPLDKENSITNTQKSLEDLMYLVEIDLKSNLKEMINCRSECKILETDEYDYWHECTKREMKRLRRYITREELKEYMRYCNKQDITLNILRDRISGNNLKELLIKREFARDNEAKFLKYCYKVSVEWQRLIVDVPVDEVILYASCVINSVQKGKSRLSLSSQGQVHRGCSIELQKESTDSGFVTI